MLVTSIFSFTHNVFKRLLYRVVNSWDCLVQNNKFQDLFKSKNNKFQDLFKSKGFSDDKMDLTQQLKFILKKHFWKRRKCWFLALIFFPFLRIPNPIFVFVDIIWKLGKNVVIRLLKLKYLRRGIQVICFNPFFHMYSF